MKKSFLTIGLAVLLFSCKKPAKTTFTPTDQTGIATLKGNITKQQAATSPVPVSGVNVSVKINNTDLYPNSPTATGSQVYNGTTDANGNYNISVRTVGGIGCPALITINNVVSTFDPITGTQATFAGTVNSTMRLITGVTQDFDYSMMNSSNLGTLTTGTATVMGTIKVVFFKENPTGVYTPTSYSLANHTVYLDFDRDPSTQVVKTYSTTSDANGNFSFNITTTAAAGYNDKAKLYVVDYPTTQDTIKLIGGTVTGKPGYYQNTFINLTGLQPTNISNGNTLTYGSFSPN